MNTQWKHRILTAVKLVGASAALSVLLVGGLVGFLFLYYSSSPPPLVHAPAFSLPDQDSRVHRLEDYRARPVVLVFYSGQDPDSERGLRSLRDVVRQFDVQGVKVFAISRQETTQQKALHDGEKLRFPLLSDVDGGVAVHYRVPSAPAAGGRAAFVIGAGGTIMQSITHLQMPRLGEQLLMLARCCLDPRRQQHVRAMGKPVPDFRLLRVADGRAEALYGNQRARATVLFVTSSQCPCSREYDQRFCAVARDYQPQGVRFVAINSNAEETVPQIAAHARTAGYPFSVLRDEGNRIADRIEAQVTPEVFVMDTARVLRYHGRIDDSRESAEVRSNDLRNALDVLLAGKLPVQPEVNAFGCAIARAANTTREPRPNLRP